MLEKQGVLICQYEIGASVSHKCLKIYNKMKKMEILALVEVLFNGDGQDKYKDKEEKRAPKVVEEEV